MKKVYKYSEERRKHMSEARKNKGTTSAQYAHLKKMIEINKKTGRTSRPLPKGKEHYNYGKHWSIEIRKKMGVKNIGRNPTNKGIPMSEEQKKKLSIAKKGKPAGHKGKLRPSIQNKNHWNWKGGISSENEILRKSLAMHIVRNKCFERDNYTCQGQGCGKVGGKLHAHHIQPFSTHPLLRFELDNLVTLCKECHIKTPTYAGRVLKYKTTIN